MCISSTNLHWRERPTNSGEKNLWKRKNHLPWKKIWDEPLLHQLNSSWAEPKLLPVCWRKRGTMISLSPPFLMGSVRQIWHNNLYHTLISKIMEKDNKNRRKQPTFVTKAELCWHCVQHIFENTVDGNLHLQRCQSLHKQDPSLSYPYQNKVSTNAVLPLQLPFHTLL